MTRKNENWVDDLRREHLKGSSRNPGAAALMSFFIMGLGQIYAGHIDRGIMLMGIYFGGIFAAISTYNGGMVYDAVFPLLGTHLMVVATYVLSVVFILLWIYNIKDAYYLSLFSSFRDWFEVERVLLPVLKAQSENLLAGQSHTAGLLTHHEPEVHKAPPEPVAVSPAPAAQAAPAAATAAAAAAESSAEHEDADVVEVKSTVREDEDEETFEPGQVIYAADFGAMRMLGQSWKVYVGLVLIFILVGVWIDNRGSENRFSGRDSETLFAFTGDMGGSRRSVSSASVLLPVDEVEEIAAAPVEPAVVQTQPVVETPVVQEPEVVTATPVEPFAPGLEQVKAGNYAEAAKLFEQALNGNEPEKEQWRIILNSFYRADNMVAYEENLRRYLNSFPDDAAAWFNLGKLLYDRTELAQASHAIVRGLRIESDNVRGNYLLGSIYMDLKLYADSITHLERAIAVEPLNLDFNRQLARALSATGRIAESRRYFQRILSLAPDDAESAQALAEAPISAAGSMVSEGQVLVVQGKNDARLVERQNAMESPAMEVTGKVLFEADPEVVPTPAAIEPVIDQPVVAAAPVVQAPSPVPVRTVSPVNPVIPSVPAPQAAKIVVPPAAPVVAAAPEAAPEPVAEPVILKPVPEAAPVAAPVKELKTAAAPEPTSAPKSMRIGENSGISAAEAVVDVEDNVEMGFRDAVAQERRSGSETGRVEELRKKGAFEFSKGNWEAALPNYLEVLKHKRDAQTYDMVGVIFEKLAMHKDAFDAVEHSYRLGRKDSATLSKLGRLAETTGNFNKGELYLQQALQKSPHRVDLRIRYARCLQANGKPEKAISELEKIIRAGGDSYAVRRRAELEISKIRSAGK